MVLPGFNDSHMHLLSWGFTMDGVELQEARSIQELIQLGLKYVQNNPGRKWILGRGFNDESFSTPGLPTRNDLDQISTGQPLVFTRVCGHICTANSRALELAWLYGECQLPLISPGEAASSSGPCHTGEPTGELLRRRTPSMLCYQADSLAYSGRLKKNPARGQLPQLPPWD